MPRPSVFASSAHAPPARVALYLHLPFCRRRCSYCDFNAYKDPGTGSQEAYHRALLEDIRQEGRRDDYTVRTIFLGGGTPSLAPPEWIAEILDACGSAFRLEAGLEVTMEANPGTLQPSGLRRLRRAGVNRLSFGVQSLDDTVLHGIERIHSAAEALSAVREAREAGFDNVNMDLMYGLPGQTMPVWEETVERVVDLGPEHVSAYALILEDGTPLKARVERGEVAVPDEDAVGDMAVLLRRRMQAAGYRQYEISNWSRAGRECRHNLVYWANEPYLGLGCGAVSYVREWRMRRILHPSHYEAALRRGRWPVVESERLGSEAAVKDTVILALRTRFGVDLAAAGARHGVPPRRLARFFDSLPEGLVRRRGRRVKLTGRGRDIASEVFVRLLGTALTLSEGEC